MKVFFDSQIFDLQRYGGISLYFSKIIQQFILNPNLGIQPIIDFKHTNNQHLSHVVPELSKAADSKLGTHPNKFINLSNREFTNDEFDLIHFTYYLPSKHLFFKSIPKVSTIHDFIPETFFTHFSFKRRMHYLKKTYLKKSNGIIYVSNHTANSRKVIYPSLSINSSAIIYHGIDTQPKGLTNDQKINKTFFLFIGNRSSYKNFVFLLNSFSKLSKNLDVNLYCYGGGEPNTSELNLLNKLKIADQVKFFSDHDTELSTLLRSAVALVNPSYDEGFGFTNLEAFSYGCPVICSDIAIFHEILEDLAIYFDPTSNASLTSRLQDFVGANSPIDRNALIAHSNKFSWTNCAKDTSNFYHEVFSAYHK